MHHKFVVRDGVAVWTGSTNWTLDSWTREENVVLTVESPDLAAAYARVFAQLWDRGRVEGTGSFDTMPIALDGAPPCGRGSAPGAARSSPPRSRGASPPRAAACASPHPS